MIRHTNGDHPGPEEARSPSGRTRLSTWQRAICDEAQTVLLLDLSTSRIVSFSKSAADLLRITPGHDVHFREVVRAEASADPLDLLRAGVVESIQGRFPYQEPGGRIVDAWWWIRAIRSADGADLALMGLQAVQTSSGTTQLESRPSAQILPGLPPQGESPTVLALDRAWAVAEVSRNPCAVGDPLMVPVGASVLELIDARDRSSLMCAFALATSNIRAGVGVRLTVGDWTPRLASVVVTVADRSDDLSFVLELFPVAPGLPHVESARDYRAAELEQRLRRIAAEVEAANVHLRHSSAEPELSNLDGLSTRQVEIARRLVRGERVPRIARELFLSQSTVRNHLTAIFRKAGVHSQDELIARLRGRDEQSASRSNKSKQ